MADSADIKPANQTINIQIKEGSEAPIIFKVKRSIRLEKVFDAFLKKKGAQAGTYR